MTRPAGHPLWCDPARCTTELDPVLGVHRGRPLGPAGGPMRVTAGLFRVAGGLTDRSITSLVELHLGALDDLSVSAGTAVGLLTPEAAEVVGRQLLAVVRAERAR